jgi:hypothetical protein
MRSMTIALFALALTTTKAAATCQEVRNPPIADRPEIMPFLRSLGPLATQPWV